MWEWWVASISRGWWLLLVLLLQHLLLHLALLCPHCSFDSPFLTSVAILTFEKDCINNSCSVVQQMKCSKSKSIKNITSTKSLAMKITLQYNRETNCKTFQITVQLSTANIKGHVLYGPTRLNQNMKFLNINVSNKVSILFSVLLFQQETSPM